MWYTPAQKNHVPYHIIPPLSPFFLPTALPRYYETSDTIRHVNSCIRRRRCCLSFLGALAGCAMSAWVPFSLRMLNTEGISDANTHQNTCLFSMRLSIRLAVACGHSAAALWPVILCVLDWQAPSCAQTNTTTAMTGIDRPDCRFVASVNGRKTPLILRRVSRVPFSLIF